MRFLMLALPPLAAAGTLAFAAPEPLVRSVTEGRGDMPPRGGLDLTDEEVRAAVAYLLQLSQSEAP